MLNRCVIMSEHDSWNLRTVPVYLWFEDLISSLLTDQMDNPVITLIVFAGKLRDGRLVKIAEDLS